jgi:hypothetical protein
MRLTDEQERIVQKSFAVGVASERFNRYMLHINDADFEKVEAERRFNLIVAMIKDLKNFCVLCGSDN